MNGVMEFLQRRLAEKEELLQNMLKKPKSWHDTEDVQIAIDGIKSAIQSVLDESSLKQVA